VTLATLHGDGRVDLAERTSAVAQFERVTVQADGVADWRDLVGRLGEELAQARAAAVCEHLVARVRLQGVSPLAWRARVDAALLLEEARLCADRLGGTWIEAVEPALTAPSTVSAAAATVAEGGADPITELARLMADEVLPSDSFRGLATDLAEDMRGHLPRDLADVLGSDEAGFQKAVAALVEAGAEEVLAHLRAGGSGDA